ncbi:MAG: hypothetical protein RL189_3113 [Pseudomonadota bacterium]|jgi:hypothetical protein
MIFPSAISTQKILHKAKRLIEDARPLRPPQLLFAQGESIEKFLLPEDSFEWPFMGIEEYFTIFLMKDGALGVGLWLTPIASEMLTEAELSSRLESLADMFAKIKNPDVSMQIIFDAEPDTQSYCHEQQTEKKNFATTIAKKRFEFLSEFARHPKNGLRMMKRRILLTLRVSGEHPARSMKGFSDSEQAAAEKSFQSRISALRDTLTHVKAGVLGAHFQLKILNRDECLWFFRDSLHSFEMRSSSQPRHITQSKSNSSLSKQMLYHSVHMTPSGLGLGEGLSADSWQCASLLDLPESTVSGLMAKLLSIKHTHRIVVNIRPVVKSSDLDSKRYLLKNADDAFGVRQFEDITATQARLNREESLLAFSLHVLLRNEKVAVEQLEEHGLMRSVLSDISPLLNCAFIEENLCAPLVFAASLPFQNSKEIVSLVGRETRLLSRNLVSLLPLYGGFQGSRLPMVQMISRAGDRIHLNPRDSNGASHLAVLGGSGAGKSFSIANMVTSFMGQYPKGRVFIIDKKTSYAALAWLAAEEGGSSYFNPPKNFPNIFSGLMTSDMVIDEDRLPSVVHLLLTAVSLLSPKIDLEATHRRVLSDALRMTIEEKLRQAQTCFDPVTGTVVAAERGRLSLPRLSEVVNNLSAACDALQFSSKIADLLTEGFSPFVGCGPYAKFFDVSASEDVSQSVPLLTLCDLDGVSGDPVLLVLTVQAIILEILRLVKPASDGAPNPPSLLIIEEVGVLASESPALVSFIRDAWKTMRKFGVTCVGVTNEVSDYRDKAGPKEIWNVSPNKLILTQNASAIAEMESRLAEGKNGLVPSLYVCEILRSLKMQKGEYAEAFWMGESAQGTYVYVPTGFDYWCAASDPIELSTLKNLSSLVHEREPECLNPTFKAICLLAESFPRGVREKGELRALHSSEREALIKKIHSNEVQ